MFSIQLQRLLSPAKETNLKTLTAFLAIMQVAFRVGQHLGLHRQLAPRLRIAVVPGKRENHPRPTNSRTLKG